MKPVENIEYLYDTISDAFHGTGSSEVQGILRDGFRPTTEINFLGDGVYFYVGSIEDASFFALRRRRKKFYAVLQSTVLKGYCLNLDTKPHKKLLERLHETLLSRDDVRKSLEDRGIKEVPLGLAINILGSEFVTIDTVMGVQINRESVVSQPGPYIGSKMWYYTKLMLCVRNAGNIGQTKVVHSNDPSLS